MKTDSKSFQPFGGIYAGRRVFVTGVSGFKGSWLAQWLVQLGADVTGYALYLPSEPCHFTEIHLDNRIRYVKGDVRNLNALHQVMVKAKPEVVFHLAAQPIVRVSYDKPLETFQTNVLGTVNILEAIRHNHCVRAAVLITSDKCYENLEQTTGYVETDRLGGKDPYSASKACAEIAFSAYARSFFGAPDPVLSIPHGPEEQLKLRVTTGSPLIATARAGNVIGGGDWAKDRIVPDCARAWSAEQTPVIRNPASTRPWQHVLEPLSGYLWLGARLLDNDRCAHGEAFNFGPEETVKASVETLIAELRTFWPEAAPPTYHPDRNAKHEAGLLHLDCGKAQRLLSWQPTLSFSETAEFTSQWYHRYLLAPALAWQLTAEQIVTYCRLAVERGRVWANQ